MFENLDLDKSSWSLVKFGDIALKQTESVDRENTNLVRYIKGEHMNSEDIHIRSWGELTDEYLGPAFIRKFEEGDILYGSRRTYLKKVAIAHFEGITSNTTFVIKPNKKLIHRGLLPFIMLSDAFTEHSIKNSKGSVNPYITWKDLAKYEFLLPPKDQQAEFAELLWAVDRVIEGRRKVAEKLKLMRLSFFKEKHSLLEGKKVKLKTLLDRKKEKSKKPHTYEKYIGLEHIEPGSFTCNDYAPSTEANAQCNVIESGDLCYSKLRPYLDKAFIADFDAVSSTELLVFDTKKVSKEYVLHHLHSHSFLSYISEMGYGTKMPRVNMKILGDYEVKILKNEDSLVSKLSKFIEAKRNVEDELKISKSLLKSLINQIF